MDEDGSGRVPASGGELAVDHVLLATSDLATAARSLRDRYGLRSVEGGRHPAWGTANWIVPVGDAYLELVAVVDSRVADESPFGRWVASAHTSLVVPMGWAVRSRSLDEVAARHGLAINAGRRASPSGELLTWRVAGLEHAAAECSLPFFIEWGEATPHPSGALGADSNDAAIARLELTGDPDRLWDWLHTEDVPVIVETGPPAVTKVVLSTADGEVSIDTAFGSQRADLR